MALTVGTDTYLSIIDADTYHSKYANSVWTAYRRAIKTILTHADGIAIVTKAVNGLAAEDEIKIDDTVNYDTDADVVTILSTTQFSADPSYVADEAVGVVMLASEYVAREAALRQASQWIDLTHVGKMLGLITSDTQSLLYPREGVYDEKGALILSTVIPELIKDATAELALLVVAGTDLYLNIEGRANRSIIQETVGPITTKYSPKGYNLNNQPALIQVERLLAPLMKDDMTGMANIVRS